MIFCRAGSKTRKHPSSVSLNYPLRSLSPYQEAVCAISTQGRSFPSARQKPLWSVGLRGTIHWPKLHAKVSATKSNLSDTPHVQSRDVSIHESCRYAAPEERKIFSSTSKNLWENPKMLRKWSDESLKSSSISQTIFRSVCLGLLNWPFTDGQEFLIKSFTFWIRRRCNRLNSRSLFSELPLNSRFFLLTIKKKESKQETNRSSSIESPRFLPFSFEELQKRSLLRRNCTEVGFCGLCTPLMYWEGFLR